jgi:hypothetical protein
MAFVQLVAIEGTICKQLLEGIIRKRNIRETKVDEIQMDKVFLPGDIVKARVV